MAQKKKTEDNLSPGELMGGERHRSCSLQFFSHAFKNIPGMQSDKDNARSHHCSFHPNQNNDIKNRAIKITVSVSRAHKKYSPSLTY